MMESKNQFSKDMLDMLDNHKFDDSKKKPTKRRKENPIEIKYETNAENQSIKQKGKDLKGTRQLFKVIYDKICEMRKEKNAPVDLIGAFTCPDKDAPEETRNFQLLVALMLSVQTKDEITAEAMTNLKKFGLTIEKMNEASEDDIVAQIRKVNFNRTKAKNIKKIAKILIEELDKKIPTTLEKITEFPGVGPKIGVLYINEVLGAHHGIGVDTHVHRIANRLGWVKTKSPEETRLELQSFIDKEYWDINELLVGFGQQICLPRNPKCEECLLNDICPEGKANTRYLKLKTKKTKETKINDGKDVLETTEETTIEDKKMIKIPSKKKIEGNSAIEKKEKDKTTKIQEDESVEIKSRKVKVLKQQKSIRD